MYAGSIEQVNITKIQYGYHVRFQLCEYPGCDVTLFWKSSGAEDDGRDFHKYCEQFLSLETFKL